MCKLSRIDSYQALRDHTMLFRGFLQSSSYKKCQEAQLLHTELPGSLKVAGENEGDAREGRSLYALRAQHHCSCQRCTIHKPGTPALFPSCFITACFCASDPFSGAARPSSHAWHLLAPAHEAMSPTLHSRGHRACRFLRRCTFCKKANLCS